ncbi:MAG TPA: nuclear transport factor 2 family protein [Sphingomonadaceae bacterium]|nr:nuclear transport factor 2 family protein [Sphingomonadaceae bacterium]
MSGPMALSRRQAGTALLAATGLGAAAAAASPVNADDMRARFRRYIALFNAGDPEALVPFFAPSVELYLPRGPLIGPQAIVDYYRGSFGFLTEWLRIDTLIVDGNGLAAELYTRFTAKRDHPGFKAMPLRAGDVYVVTTFVLYDFDEAGRFSRIRPAMWQRDLSGVRSREG